MPNKSMESGAPVSVPFDRLPMPLRFECCDCGLVHMCVFTTQKEGFTVYTYRDDDATRMARKERRGAARRHKKKARRTWAK